MSDWHQGKAKVLSRLKRAEGQVRAVRAMLEREDDCERVAQQLSAARKALDRAFYELMGCMTRRELAGRSGRPNRAAMAQVDRLTRVLARYG